MSDVRTDLRPRGREYITVLSLDGGGIRGLIAARVVEALERRTGMPACRLFDLIAGTSTGGVIALGLTKPGTGGSPRYSATDLVELYRTQGPKIFRRTFGHTLVTLGGLAGPKYPAGAIERVVEGYFGETRITEALTSVLVTSYDTAAASPALRLTEPVPGGRAAPVAALAPGWAATGEPPPGEAFHEETAARHRQAVLAAFADGASPLGRRIDGGGRCRRPYAGRP